MTPAREEWRPVLGYEGCYEVSDQGRVRSIERTAVRRDRWGGTHQLPVRGRLLRQSFDARDGRPQIRLKNGGRGRTFFVQTLILAAFVGPRPPGMEACHNNGDPTDNRLSNLRWDTHSANMYDRQRHGSDHKRNRTHCPQRHALVAPNLDPTIAARGHRNCRACASARKAAWKAKRRGRSFDFQAAADARYARIMEE